MLIISYGQPKSASTFMVNLLKRACAAMGSEQEQLKDRVFVGDLSKYRNFLRDIDALREISLSIGQDDYLAIKTHGALTRSTRELIDGGKAVAFLSYRHPGDAALSIFEAGARERAAGKSVQFSRLDTHRKAIDSMAGHIRRTTVPWLKSGLAHPFSYQQITQDGETAVQRIANIIGVDGDALLKDEQVSALLSGEKRVYNYNKGVSGRHREVFSSEDLMYLEERCGKFNRFCNGEIGVEAL